MSPGPTSIASTFARAGASAVAGAIEQTNRILAVLPRPATRTMTLEIWSANPVIIAILVTAMLRTIHTMIPSDTSALIRLGANTMFGAIAGTNRELTATAMPTNFTSALAGCQAFPMIGTLPLTHRLVTSRSSPLFLAVTARRPHTSSMSALQLIVSKHTNWSVTMLPSPKGFARTILWGNAVTVQAGRTKWTRTIDSVVAIWAFADSRCLANASIATI